MRVSHFLWQILRIAITLTTVGVAVWVVAFLFRDYLLNPWIRLAQRVPVRINPTKIPPGVQLRVGTTATVIVLHDEDPAKRKKQWLRDLLRADEHP